MTRLPEGAFHRAPRPLIMWAGFLLVAGGIVFLFAVGAAIALGFWATAPRGQPVPDMSGGLGIIATAVATVGAFVMQVLQARHRERRDEIAFGGAPANPTISPAPSGGSSSDIPGGGLVNNEALR